MILRLTVMTVLMATFAVSFSALVEHDGRNANAYSQNPTAGCFDQGAVCAPAVGD